MKTNYLFKLLLIGFIFTGFISCDDTEDDEPDYYGDFYTDPGSNVSGNDSSWSAGYWKKDSGNTYLDIQANTPEFCINGNAPTSATYSAINWTSGEVGYFTLYNNGDEVEFQITRSGENMIVSSWDPKIQATHNPSTYFPSSSYPCAGSGNGSGGSSGGGSGGGSSTGMGKISFYTTSDLGCGNITVTVDGNNTRTISSYHSGGIPDCNQSSVTNFTLPVGTHSYTANCNGYTWSYTTFTITEGGCIKYRLQ